MMEPFSETILRLEAELARLREAIRNDCQHEYGGIPAWMEETRAVLKETDA